MRNFDWDDLRYFLAVAAAGSLSAAARGLQVNTTTVLRRIGGLEAALEARLFERLRSGYSLTAAGARLLEQLDPIEQRLTALQRDFQASQPMKGAVRVCGGEVICSELLAPALSAFHARHTDIAVELINDPSLVGPGSAPRVLNSLRDTDLSVRLSRPTQGDMLVRKLSDMAYALYARGKAARPVKGGDLSGRAIIGFAKDDAPLGPVWYLARAERGGDIVLRSSCVGVRLQAALDGLGVAALPCIIGDKHPKLRRIAEPSIVGALEVWLLTRADLAQLPHVRAVMDFIIDTAENNRHKLAGVKDG